MEAYARVRQLSLSPKKLQPIAGLIRGMAVEEALVALRYHPSPWARQVAKVVRSAAANAENNFQLDPQELRITRVDVGDGVALRRFYPRARGRVARIKKRHSHLTVVVDDERS